MTWIKLATKTNKKTQAYKRMNTTVSTMTIPTTMITITVKTTMTKTTAKTKSLSLKNVTRRQSTLTP